MSTKSPSPKALHTAPSGKVTKWGAPGTDQVFKTKREAQAAIDRPTSPAKPKTKDTGPTAARFLAALPKGAEVVDPNYANGTLKLRANGRPLGYLVRRRHGFQIEVFATRLEDAPVTIMDGTTEHQGQTRLHVTDAKTLRQAKALVTVAAKSVA